MPPKRRYRFNPRIYTVLFLLVMLVAVYLRLTGIDWDSDQHLHPDERFLTGVVSSIAPVDSLGAYFDTATSSLNPNNRGAGFFVYGTLPLFIVRYVAEWTQNAGYGEIHLVGRQLSAWADLGVVALVYFIGTRLFDKRAGLLAAAFAAFSVMQIQQSHFWTVDNFANFFSLLSLFFAVRVATYGKNLNETKAFSLWDFVGFGIAFGLSLASKINQPSLVLAQALLLPLAAVIRLWALPRKERQEQISNAIWLVVLAGGLSFITFRIFQPYAFQGLGLAGWWDNITATWGASDGLSVFERIKQLVVAVLGLNSQWVDTMSSLAAQVNGDADWPPSMQWARRPFWFGLQNIVGWGLGWPLALLCLGGLAWAGWRVYKGDWNKPWVVLWAWGAIFFLVQSSAFNPTMRYFLPLYPVLVIFGAWAVVALWDAGAEHVKARGKARFDWHAWARPAAGLIGALAILGASLWAFAFVQIYHQEVSRIQATRWIYQNLPGPLTLNYSREGEQIHQPVHVAYDAVIAPESPLVINVFPQKNGVLTQIEFKHVVAPISLKLDAVLQTEGPIRIYSRLVDLESMQVGEATQLVFELPVDQIADPAALYRFTLQLPAGRGLVRLITAELRSSQSIDLPGQSLIHESVTLDMGDSLPLVFNNSMGVAADRFVILFDIVDPVSISSVRAHLKLISPDSGAVIVEQDVTLNISTNKSDPDTALTLDLPRPIAISQNQPFILELSVRSGLVSLLGTAVANESSWDDGLPLRMFNYDGFGGIYQGDLNFEMYWDSDASKLARFLDVLERGEYLFISSSRQWGSLPRIPERFPLVVAYYRALLGCPDEQPVESCLINAQVENVQSDFGFELIQVFENAPMLGSWKLNDQSGEEAFTVYDHPKVFIFQKTAEYDGAQWKAYLEQVDLTKVIRLTPKQATGGVPRTLQLPVERWEQQQAGGTWAELFDTESWINSSPWVSAVVWYLALGALGVAVYPLVRWLLPGLRDGGYPFARLVGLMLLAYLAWMGGSLGLTFSRGWLAVFALLLVSAGGVAAWLLRKEFAREWKTRRAQFLRVEVLFLAFFLIMLLIRVANPDLWHPAYGGEKPMDFSYFNAVLKSTTFPAYDPWFAGGYINYYYYGFVLVGALVKLLGIVPAVAYNLILPSLFAMLALGAYSLSWNLWTAWKTREGRASRIAPEFVGLAAAIGVLILGNLGSLDMLLVAFAKLGAEGAYVPDSPLLTNIGWMLRGFTLSLSGQQLPVGRGDWYWNPTRIIPALNETGPITEFPLFTFIYADLHAHMIALPVTLLGLAWSVSAILSRAWSGLKNKWQAGASLVLGAIIIGSLRPINTWDLPTYLLIAALAIGYAVWKYGPRVKHAGRKVKPPWKLALGGMAALAVFSVLAYQPFASWYRQGYSSVDLWTGTHTPTGPYLVHWAIFLFFIVAWLIWETRQWLASTPLSSLRSLEKYTNWLIASGAFFVFAWFLLFGLGVHTAWLIFPLLLWVGLLFFRPGLDEVKRLVLFLAGTGIFLTLIVEVIVLKGDISRMNTVFKFYMQAWVLLAVSAAFALAWTLDSLRKWRPSWRGMWQAGAAVLIACGGLFMLLGVTAKAGDRMAANAPQTLDGLAYMPFSVYFDRDQQLDLVNDYQAIRWMQENVQGSPVIVEANTGEYRWGSRFTINTGLPSVVGWNWHQRQQREFVPGNDVQARVNEVEVFYQTFDLELVRSFLKKYDVKYIIVGQLERAYYPDGVLKFEAQDGNLWKEVYRGVDTVIYEVLDSSLADE